MSGYRLRKLDGVAPGYEVAIVGAGPAGMSAAIELGSRNISVLVIDDKPSPGGQIYHSITRSPLRPDTILGRDYWAGRGLVQRFQAAVVDYLPQATVWQIENGAALFVSVGGASRRVNARHIILATGALERPFPVAGWTSPGVMGVGAAQIMLKTSGALPEGRTVLLGSGPLLWLFASQMIAAGRPPLKILGTGARRAGAPFGAALAFLGSSYARKGAALIWNVRRKVAWTGGVQRVRIEQQGGKLAVHHASDGRRDSTVSADHVLVHQGVTPNMNLARAASCDIVWDDPQAYWKPATDGWGTSSVPTIAIAGDGAGISGALAAVHMGRLAALNAAVALGRIDAAARDGLSRTSRLALARERRVRRFLDHLYRPTAAMRAGDADAIVCRCEEVTGADVRAVVRRTHALGPNQLKAFLRCGMGPCQGRYCSLTINEIIAQERRVSPSEVEPMRIRPPIKPVTLQELASLDGN